MAKLSFNTGNSAIIGEVRYSCTRTADEYKVSYEVYMKRTNTNTGDATSGTIEHTVYIKSNTITATTKGYTVKNDNSWCLLTSGYKTYSLDTFDTSTFTIGFSSKDKTTGHTITAFNVSKVTSSAQTVNAYAKAISAHPVTISYTAGSNKFSLSTTIPKATTNNALNSATVYYTTNGDDPTKTTSTRTAWQLNVASTAQGKTITTTNITIPTDCTQVRAVMMVVGTYNNPSSAIANKTVAYYSAPTWDSDATIDITSSRSKFDTKATYTITWPAAHNGVNNAITSYEVRVDVRQEQVKVYTAQPNSRTVSFEAKNLNLQKGDNIDVWVTAYGQSSYNNISKSLPSETIWVVSAGTVKIKVNNQWKEGQVWIKNNGSWIEADEVYIKTNGVWKSST